MRQPTKVFTDVYEHVVNTLFPESSPTENEHVHVIEAAIKLTELEMQFDVLRIQMGMQMAAQRGERPSGLVVPSGPVPDLRT